MNVFILNTGRCGSTTFIRACQHIHNYSSAHESRSAIIGDEHFNYPDNHIEADNRLCWLLGRLEDRFGDDAIYIHLKRNTLETAKSFTQRYSGGIMKAYRGEGILMGASDTLDPMTVAMDYCHTVDRNITLFLKDKTQTMAIDLETIDSDFQNFWKLINAEGDIQAALSEFTVRYNKTEPAQAGSPKSESHGILKRLKGIF